MPPITEADIRRIMPLSMVEAGRAYHRRGRVLRRQLPGDGSTIKASVQGSRPRPYQQTIALRRQGQPRVTSVCTCPVGGNCKHVAAVLFASIEEAEAGKAEIGKAEAGKAEASTTPLPSEIERWLGAIQAISREDGEEYEPSVRKRLIYVLEQSATTGGLALSFASIEVMRDGRVADRPRSLMLQRIGEPPSQPKFLRPSDREIIWRLLHGGGPEAGEGFDDTLGRILDTGRARWGTPLGAVVSRGEALAGGLCWRADEDGTQRPDLQLPDGLIGLRMAPPRYYDPARERLGTVVLDIAAPMLRTLLTAPPLAPQLAGRVRGALQERLPPGALPLPRELAPAQVLDRVTRPRLDLIAGALPFDPHATSLRHGGTGLLQTALARLSFRYGPLLLPHSSRRAHVMQDGQLFSIIRDHAAEARAMQRLRGHGFARVASVAFTPPGHPHADDLLLLAEDDDPSWINVLLETVPTLEREGWEIVVTPEFPIRVAVADGDIEASVRDGSGIDWFEFELGVMVEGERINLVPALIEALGAGALTRAESMADEAPLLLRLPDGRMLALPMERLRPILGPLLELFDGGFAAEGSVLRLSRAKAAELARLEAASGGTAIAWRGGEAIRALGQRLRDTGGIPAASLPAGFAATLRPYQARGVDWLQFLGGFGLCGILADDMGLGKTVQALAHLAIEQAEGRLDRPALVICPTSLVANWQAEALRFAPSLSVLTLHGPERAARFHRIAAHDVVLTTYPLLARDHAALTSQPWHAVVLDEAQIIKNPLAVTSKLARTLEARQRLCLSGTPMENHLGELWSLFDFLMPGFLGDRQSFGRRFRVPIEKGGDAERQAQLARRVSPFLLRRTKQEVAADLPPKSEIVESVEMAPPQQAIYEAIRLAMHAKVKRAIRQRGLAGSGIIILDALLKLRQACCDPRLLKLESVKAATRKRGAASAKLERLLELLPTLLEEGRRVLLFSQFTSMLALIEAELRARRLPCVLLTGDTRDRAEPIRRFQSGEVPLFLISLKAGGVGLNLTAADTVIHYDPWWNPAVEDQATDRAHRIGQHKPVFVHRLVTSGTIEEKMEMLKSRKQALVAGVLGASPGGALSLTADDVDILFAAA